MHKPFAVAPLLFALFLFSSPIAGQTLRSAPMTLPIAQTIPAAQDIPYPGTIELDIDATDVVRGVYLLEPTMRDLPLPTFPLADLSAPAALRRSLQRHEAPLLDDATDKPRFDVAWAHDEADVRQAQQLRYRVFAEEMSARLTVPHGSPGGHDIDMFDPYCEHLLVRAPAVGGEPGPVIGTYRVLTPANARRVGALYSENEFDLTRLARCARRWSSSDAPARTPTGALAA